MELFEKVMAGCFTAILALLIYLLVLAGFGLNGEAKCLERGYPAAVTTWKFDTYCTNLDGVVYGKVVSLDDE